MPCPHTGQVIISLSDCRNNRKATGVYTFYRGEVLIPAYPCYALHFILGAQVTGMADLYPVRNCKYLVSTNNISISNGVYKVFWQYILFKSA